jgi:hypothetical protein
MTVSPGETATMCAIESSVAAKATTEGAMLLQSVACLGPQPIAVALTDAVSPGARVMLVGAVTTTHGGIVTTPGSSEQAALERSKKSRNTDLMWDLRGFNPMRA